MDALQVFLRSIIQDDYCEEELLDSLVDVHGVKEVDDLQNVDFSLLPTMPGLKTVQYARFKRAVKSKFSHPTTPNTISTPSPSASQSSATPTTPPDSLAYFNIPYERFPASLKKLVSEKKRQTEKDKTNLVNFLFDEIYTINKKTGKQFLERIAAEVVNKYPLSFREEENGKPIDSGCRKLARKLEFKMHNANRYKRTNLFPNGANGSTQKKRIIPKDRYGCINFLPTGLPENETQESQNEKKLWLVEEFEK
jgi:hypothetical protein